MPFDRTCPDPDCPNRGILTIDTNFLFYLIEGTIKYVRYQFPNLVSHASRLACVLEELDNYLDLITECCSSDGRLYISGRIFYDEVLAVDPREKNLEELSKYTSTQRQQILQVLCAHFPQPSVVPKQEIQELRGLYINPNTRPHNRDASLIVMACHLAANEEPIIVLTSDPDFIDPIRFLARWASVDLGSETFPTNRIMNRDCYSFLRRLHDCCCLSTSRYNPWAKAFFSARLERLSRLENKLVRDRDLTRLNILWDVHTESIAQKSARVQA